MKKPDGKSFLVLSQAGCLLPFLITFNLFFGWMFLRKSHWLLLEAGLIFTFIINSIIITKKFFYAAGTLPKRSGAIDVDAQVIDDDKK